MDRQKHAAISVGRRLSAIPDHRMRRHALAQILSLMSESEALCLIRLAATQGRGSSELEVVHLTLAAVLEEGDLDYERQAALYELAKRRGDDVVAPLLLGAGRASQAHPLELPPEPVAPLGYRKSCARSSGREMIDRHLRDPNPSVLESLMSNPRLLRRDVVLLAARRPTTAEAQRVVFKSRFGRDYEVRLALVMNPYTPTDLSIRILPGLLLPDIKEAASSMILPAALRDVACRLVDEKTFRPSNPGAN